MNSQLALVFGEALKLSNNDLQILISMLRGVIERDGAGESKAERRKPNERGRSKQQKRKERFEAQPDESDKAPEVDLNNVKPDVKPKPLSSRSPVPAQPAKRNPLNSIYLHFQCAYDFITGDVSSLTKRNSTFIRSNAEKVKKDVEGLRKLADEGIDGYRKWVSESEGGKHQLLMNDPTENFEQAIQQVVDWATTSIGSVAPDKDE